MQSYSTRFTCGTSLTIRLATVPRTSQRDLCCLCGHEVDRIYGSQRDRVIVSSLITHNAYGAHISQCCEVLTDIAVDSCLCNLFAVDCICLLYHLYLFRCNRTDNTDTKSRTRERLTVYKLLRNSEFQTGLTNLVFKQVAKWLDNFLKVNVIWKSSYIVVGFDHCGLSAEATLNNVRINCSLYQEVNGADLLCLFLEYADKLFADDLSLSLRLLNAS